MSTHGATEGRPEGDPDELVLDGWIPLRQGEALLQRLRRRLSGGGGVAVRCRPGLRLEHEGLLACILREAASPGSRLRIRAEDRDVAALLEFLGLRDAPAEGPGPDGGSP